MAPHIGGWVGGFGNVGAGEWERMGCGVEGGGGTVGRIQSDIM